MDEVKNLEAAKKLLKKYRSITLEAITKKWNELVYTDGEEVLSSITGFGAIKTCSLCRCVGYHDSNFLYEEPNCVNCIYTAFYNELALEGHDYPCILHKSYHAISSAKTPEELFDAIHNRADYLEKVIKELS